MFQLTAVTVCVDYADLLALTLPYNRHHFSRYVVVTTLRDTDTIKVAGENDAEVLITDSFYKNGADFNKWLALENALDWIGREGLLALIDADTLWPREVEPLSKWFRIGNLYTPKRTIWGGFDPKTDYIPGEPLWRSFAKDPNPYEWAGYTQIFHCSDVSLGEPPWHETNWRHAGGADSFFQRKWPTQNKLRPPFEVLHLGRTGTNWAGREPQQQSKLTEYLNERRRTNSFNHEKL